MDLGEIRSDWKIFG